MGLYKSNIVSSDMKIGKVSLSNTTRVRVELGFRPRYVTIIGWHFDNNQGTTCVYNEDVSTTYQFRTIIRTNPAVARITLGNDNYVGTIYSIDDTGFYMSKSVNSSQFTNNYWSYVAFK